jgi:hypothetical protein
VRLPGRILDRLADDRFSWAVLGVAMAISIAVGLWLTRGTTFFVDEVTYYLASNGFDLDTLLSPHNGHLILVPRVIYATVFDLFGADYVVFRLLEFFGVAITSGLFFALAKKRVGGPAALGPSILLLFFGAAWVDTLTPVGITHIYCVMAGLGALLALDRRSRLGDVLACGLLVVAVATFSIGLSFAIGVAVAVLLRPDRWRRAWIFAVPIGLYVLWYVAGPRIHGLLFLTDNGFEAKNLLLIPSFVGQAAAAVTAAVSGLSYDFSDPANGDITYSVWGVVIATAAVVALALRVRRGRVPRTLWAAIAALVAYWASTAVVSGRTGLGATPQAGRYVYAGAVLALLVAVEALRDRQLSRRAIAVILCASALALAGNIALLRSAYPSLRSYATSFRSQLTAIEVARRQVAPDFGPQTGYARFTIPEGAGVYLSAVDRNGSFAYSVPDLLEQSEGDREGADATVAAAERIELAPAGPLRPQGGCQTLAANGTASLGPPGVILRSPTEATVTLGRFADNPTVDLGALSAGRPYALRVPVDESTQPWRVAVAGKSPVTVCPIGGGG